MYRNLDIDEEILINQFTQRLVTLDKMNSWFNDFGIDDKRAIVHNLLNITIQSHPTYDEIEMAAKSINKASSTSAVKLLNRNKPYNKFGYELCALPEKELINSFNILLITFSISDNRRKSSENPKDCNHWWHKDLSDETYLESLRNNIK